MLAEYAAGRLPTLAGIKAVDPFITHTEEVIDEELTGFGIEHDKEDVYPLIPCREIIEGIILE